MSDEKKIDPVRRALPRVGKLRSAGVPIVLSEEIVKFVPTTICVHLNAAAMRMILGPSYDVPN